MKQITISKKRFSNLSKNEIYLISRAEYEKKGVITTSFAQGIFESKDQAAKVLMTLTRKGRAIRIEKGKYLLVPMKAPNQLWTPNEFLVAGYWMENVDYYIGYFTMYHYWGFTEQVPQTMVILNTHRSCKKTISHVRFEAVKIRKEKYYGIKKIKIDGIAINISDKERTLVDFIHHPIGSFDKMTMTLKENLKTIDFDKFIRYLNRFPVLAVRKRAGFMLDALGISNTRLAPLKKNLGGDGSYVPLNPFNKSRAGKINKEWRIIVNR